MLVILPSFIMELQHALLPSKCNELGNMLRLFAFSLFSLHTHIWVYQRAWEHMTEGLCTNGRCHTKDSWTSWGVKGVVVLHLLCFLFMLWFVICKLWGFFMVVTTFVVDLTIFLLCAVLVKEGVWAWQYMSRFLIEEKTKFLNLSEVLWWLILEFFLFMIGKTL
jgi:multisubunit Na+/H+ antiporter MnhG subunit